LDSTSFFSEPLEPRRLLAAGQLDTSFGNGGAFNIPTTSVEPLVARAPGGDVVVVFPSDTAKTADGSTQYLVTRLTRDGQVDATFGGAALGQPKGTPAGTALVPPELNFRPEQVRVNTDGSILLAGLRDVVPTNGATQHATLIKLRSDGRLATNFGGAARSGAIGSPLGTVDVRTLGGLTDTNALAIAPDGRIAVAGAGPVDLTRAT
jgi:hypothetical protein